MTSYDDTLAALVAFDDAPLHGTLADALEAAGLRQLHVAETEKYAHVTYFFGGGREADPHGRGLGARALAARRRDLRPGAGDVGGGHRGARSHERFGDGYAFAIVNIANPDMVGHSGVLPAVIEGVEAADAALGVILAAVERAGGVALVTADHGNAEQMLEPDGSPHTAHTTNPVPLVITLAGARLREGGKLGDIAPTVLGAARHRAAAGDDRPEPARLVSRGDRRGRTHGARPRAAGPDPNRAGSLAVLREREFAYFFWGQTVSVLGDGIFPIALAFAVLDLGGSPSALGVVLVAGILPQILFVLVGGVWADRLPRRTIMLATDVARAVIQLGTAALLLSGHAQIWQLAVLYGLHATASAFFMPAATALVPAGHAARAAAAGQRAARHHAQHRLRRRRGLRRPAREPRLVGRRGRARRLHVPDQRRLHLAPQRALRAGCGRGELPLRAARGLRRGAQPSLALARPRQRVPVPDARGRAVRDHRAR